MAIPPPKKVKIGPKTVDYIFIGYAHNRSAYRFLVHKSNIPDIHKNMIMESRNTSFFEDVFLRRSQVHQKVSWRLLMKIGKIKIKIVRLNPDIVKE